LPEPVHAEKRIRRLLNPVTGWFRRFERAVNHCISRQVYPRVPGMHRIYDFQLRHRLTLAEGTIPLRNLPQELEGLKLLLVSDIHCGPFLSPGTLAEAFGKLMRLQPDLVVLAGDFVTSRVSDFPPQAGTFQELSAPLGVFGVLGNHDHYTEDTGALIRRIQDAGVRLLQNARVEIGRGSGRLILAGVDDMTFGEPDLGRALDGRPDASPAILVSHNPDLFFQAARAGADLVLSGHTHGGQIRLPGSGVLVRMSRYHLDEGRYRAGGAELVISRGLGAVGLPLRMFCPPEAVLLTLTSEAG